MKQSHIDLFKKLEARPDGGAVEKGLLILSTPRSGSTMFCNILTNSGHVGICDEWFNENYFAAWAFVMRKATFNLKEYLKWVCKKTIGDTGVFAVHIHIGQLISVTEQFDFKFGDMSFDHIVWLYRRDKVAQAVSFAKAHSLNKWRDSEEADNPLDISYTHIADRLRDIVFQDQFYRQNISCHVDAEYAYETFANACNYRIFDDVMKAVGKPAVTNLKVDTKMQRTSETTQIAKDFSKYLSGE